MSTATIWTIMMDVYLSDVTVGNAFYRIVSFNVMPNNSLTLWSEALLNIIRDPTNLKLQGL